MKYLKAAALLSFALLFVVGCVQPRVQAPKLHQRPAGFWENEKAVVQVWHFFYIVPADENGLPLADANGMFVIQQMWELGTGGVLDVNGLVITNNHVVTASPTVGAFIVQSPQFPDTYAICTVTDDISECAPGEVAYKDPDHDLALLYTDQRFQKAIEFADHGLKRGDEIYFWGNPGKLLPPAPFFGRYIGRVGLPYYAGDEIPKSMLPILLADINASYGSSGGPAFDEEGKCIGIVVGFRDASVMGSRSLSFIISVSMVRKSLANW